MADRERLIQKRYQLQSVLTKGSACTIYLAFEQELQRVDVLKLIPADYIATYKPSIRLTPQ